MSIVAVYSIVISKYFFINQHMVIVMNLVTTISYFMVKESAFAKINYLHTCRDFKKQLLCKAMLNIIEC